MKTITILTLATLALIAPHTHASAVPSPVSRCDLPTTRDLIIWERRPRILDSAIEVGDADLLQCKATLDTWASTQPTGSGYCAKIAWASDNPGYNVEERPALPLKNVIDAVGEC
jgi:hypothetical protein